MKRPLDEDPSSAADSPLAGSLSTRVARGVASMAVGRGGAALLEFAAIAVLAGAIGPGGLGIYTFAVGIVTLFRLIPNLGLLPVVTRDIAQDPARERVLVPNVIYLRAVLGAAAYALLAGTVVIAGYSGDARDAALIAGTILLLLPLDTLQIVLQVRLRMASISVAVIAQSLVNLAAVVVLVGAGVTATSTYLLVYVGAHVLGTAVVTVIALRTAPLSWRPDLSTWRPVLAAAIPLGLAVLLVTLYTRLDLAVLAALKPADEAGQYGVAYRFLDAFLLLSPVMMSVLTPVLARSQADPEALRRRFARVLLLIWLVAGPVAVLGPLTAWRLLPALPGFEAFDGAGVALAIMAPGAAVIIMGTVVQGALIAAHLQRLLLRISAVGLAINLGLIAVLIPWQSYVGAAVATTATEVLVVGISIVVAHRRLGLALPYGRMVRTAPALVASAGVAVLCLPFSVFVQLPAAVAAYAAVVALTRVVDRADLAGLARARS